MREFDEIRKESARETEKEILEINNKLVPNIKKNKNFYFQILILIF